MSYIYREVKGSQEVKLHACIRSVICNNESQLVSIYNIMTAVNRCLGSPEISTDYVMTLIKDMEDVHREPTTDFYYYCSTEAACDRFRSRMQGNIKSCTREKIKRIIHSAPKLIIEASQHGQLKLELEELTEAEYEQPTIAAAVNSVLRQLYKVNVFMKKVVDTQKQEIVSYAPFREEKAGSSNRYWLCVELADTDHTEKQKKTVRFSEPLQDTRGDSISDNEKKEGEPASELQQ